LPSLWRIPWRRILTPAADVPPRFPAEELFG
jgi:hypothetical protein